MGVVVAGLSVAAVNDTLPKITGCVIKGNISMNTGERIYHTPSQQYYDETIVNSAKGERWFCSESDARAAGWRKSKV